jgi:glucose-1-phosphate adenylyltransferase
MGCDSFETAGQLRKEDAMGIPHMSIGRKCSIERAIIDKNAHIGDGVVIRSHPEISEKDGDNHYVRDGIVIVPRGGVIPSGTVI